MAWGKKKTEVKELDDSEKKSRAKLDITAKIKKTGMTIGGIALIGLMISYAKEPRVLSLMLVLSSIFVGGLFVPMALLLGNKIKLCFFLRMLTGRNFGIVRVVKGSIIESEKIKNLRHDYIEIDGNIHVLQNGRIYEDGGDGIGKPLEDSKIQRSSGVPILHIDPSALTLLSFHQDSNAMSPKMISSVLTAHANNREAELLSVRKQQKMSITIVLILMGAAAFFAYSTNDTVTGDLIPTVNNMQSQLNQISAKTGAVPVTVPAEANIVNQVEPPPSSSGG